MEKERKERPGEEGDYGVQGRERDRVREDRDREMQTDTERDTETLNS